MFLLPPRGHPPLTSLCLFAPLQSRDLLGAEKYHPLPPAAAAAAAAGCSGEAALAEPTGCGDQDISPEGTPAAVAPVACAVEEVGGPDLRPDGGGSTEVQLLRARAVYAERIVYDQGKAGAVADGLASGEFVRTDAVATIVAAM